MGSWNVTGSDEGQFFRLDAHGYSASGVGKHHYGHYGWQLKELESFRQLPAHWTVYRARDSADSARLIGLNASDMKEYLDPERVRLADKPVWVITKYEECVGFAIFLPDDHWNVVIDWLERIGCGAAMSYQFCLACVGLVPKSIQDRPDLVSCDDWLKGRPYVNEGDEFAFVVRPRNV